MKIDEKTREELIVRNTDGSVAIDYNRFIDQIDENWSQLEKARFLYIALGKFFVYDSKFVSESDKDKRKEIWDRGMDDIKDNKIICTSIARIYTKLLKTCGIQAEMVEIPPDEKDPKDIGHGYTQITIDGKKGSAGLIHDLTNAKVGFKTEDFFKPVTEERVETYKEELRKKGLSEEEINAEIESKRKEVFQISEPELRRIDQKIGYPDKRGIYMDDRLYEVKKFLMFVRKELRFAQLSDKEWLRCEMDFITKRMGHDELTCIEKNDYLKKAIDQCIGKEELEKFNVNTITCFDNDGKMKIFHLFDPKVKKGNEDRLAYVLTQDGIEETSQREIDDDLEKGLTTLSKSKREEYMSILRNDKTKSKEDEEPDR